MNRVCDTLVTRILLWTVSEATSWLPGPAGGARPHETNVAMTPAISAKYEAGSANFDADIAQRSRRADRPRRLRSHQSEATFTITAAPARRRKPVHASIVIEWITRGSTIYVPSRRRRRPTHC